MSYKLGFFAGAAAGYVLGARAGRTRYEQIKQQSVKAWNSDPVQHAVVDAAAAVKTKAPQAAHGLVDKAVDAITSDDAPAPRSTTSSSSATSSTSSTSSTSGATGTDSAKAGAFGTSASATGTTDEKPAIS